MKLEIRIFRLEQRIGTIRKESLFFFNSFLQFICNKFP